MKNNQTYYKLSDVLEYLRTMPCATETETKKNKYHADDIERDFTRHIIRKREFIVSTDLLELIGIPQFRILECFCTGYSVYQNIKL